MEWVGREQRMGSVVVAVVVGWGEPSLNAVIATMCRLQEQARPG